MSQSSPGTSPDFELAHSWCGVDYQKPLVPETDVVSRMLAWATTRPSDPYLVAIGPDSRAQTLSFGELENRSGRVCAWATQELGVRPGDIVALMPRNDLPSIVTLFGLLRAGTSVFIINPAEPSERLAEFLAALPVAAVLAPSPEVAARQPLARAVPDSAGLPNAAPGRDLAPVRPMECAFYFGTSGSTSTSKLVAQAHYNAAVNAEAVCRHHGIESGTRVLGCLPIHHVNGLHFTVLAPLWGGGCSVLLETFRPDQYEETIARYRPHVASVVPSILETLLSSWQGTPLPPEFRHFVSAAAPITAGVCAAVHSTIGARVLQGYGLTETVNFSTTMPRDLSDADYCRLMIDVDVPSIGVALYGTEVTVLSADGRPVAPGEIGEICMRGHSVTLGYAGNEEATREAFRGGWFHSQDLGYWIEGPGGRAFFVITGRTKNIAKVFGIAVSLEEMERALRRHPAITDAACVSVADPITGESIIAVVVAQGPLDTDSIHGHLGGYFGPVTLPRRYVKTDAIPRSTTGKILRGQLLTRFAEPSVDTRAASSAAPRSVNRDGAPDPEDPNRVYLEARGDLDVRLEGAEVVVAGAAPGGVRIAVSTLERAWGAGGPILPRLTQLLRYMRTPRSVRFLTTHGATQAVLQELQARGVLARTAQTDALVGDEFFAVLPRAESDVLVVQFRGSWYDVVDGVPPLEFSHATGLSAHNLIVVRDARSKPGREDDYAAGVSELVCNFDALTAWVLGVRAGLGNIKRTFCLGTSAGAYAAMVVGARLGAEKVWAFSPVDRGDPPLREVIARQPGETEFDVWFGVRNAADAAVLASIESCPRVRVHSVETSSHLVVRALWDQAALPRLLPSTTTGADVGLGSARGRLRTHTFQCAKPISAVEVRAMLVQICPAIPPQHPDDAPLHGLVDSFQYVVLVSRLQHEFHVDSSRIHIGDGELASIATITELVRRSHADRVPSETPQSHPVSAATV